MRNTQPIWRSPPNLTICLDNDMDAGLLAVTITGLFSVVVAIIHRGFKRQQHDHGIIADSLDRIEQKLDRHIENHD